jgi:hypothetical protein
MGSFFTTCSVTRKTIVDGQDMVVQFMLPTRLKGDDKSIGEVFVESFLNVAKEKGIDAAIKSFNESTSTWGDSGKLGEKGMIIHDSASASWVPFGPAIRGQYNDCGDIELSEDPENLERVKLLENLLFGIPFESIIDLAQDSRWYTLGMGKYADKEDSTRKLKGVDKSLPEPAITLCRYLNVTFIHGSVYDKMSKYDFCGEEGVMKSKYSKEWKDGYIQRNMDAMKKMIEALNQMADDSELDIEEKLEKKWAFRESANNISIFRNMFCNELSIIYQTCLAREAPDLKWFEEILNFMYSLSGLGLRLEPSNYGGQQTNWKGWKRINSVSDEKIESWKSKHWDEDEKEEDEE